MHHMYVGKQPIVFNLNIAKKRSNVKKHYEDLSLFCSPCHQYFSVQDSGIFRNVDELDLKLNAEKVP